MILLFSEANDESTNEVIRWLVAYGWKWKRINNLLGENHKVHLHIGNDENLFVRDNWSHEGVKGVWFRRRPECVHSFVEGIDIGLANELAQVLGSDYDCLYLNLKTTFDAKVNILGDPTFDMLDKLTQLRIASQHHIKIPHTLVTNSRTDLVHFKKTVGQVVTKGLSNPIDHKVGGVFLMSYTCVVDDELIEQLPQRFHPSLFQEQILKEYELRIFYLNEELFSMVIFSQSDEHTSVDFRRYNRKRPNRTVPYVVPEELRFKVVQFMKDLNLNCGSLDFAVTPDGHYVFFEVNPNGQYGMVSHPCNYQLDKRISEYLTQ